MVKCCMIKFHTKMWLRTLFLVINLMKVVMPTVLNCECGVPSGTSAFAMRIVGGRRAEPHSQPWAVVIMKKNAVHCGGAIITTKHVLSAGHCFKWDNFNDMLVYIGLDSLDNLKDIEKRKIGSVDIHEGFKSTAVRDENDIAIAQLAQPVVFGQTIWPICLPEPGENFGNRIGTIVGWGRVAVDQAASRVLLKATLRILTDQECMMSGLAEHLTNNMMCAFTKGIDGCQGDSGGPMLVFQNSGSYVQAGIVSWGFGCADPRFPGVYTKVADYIPWIKEHSQDGDTCVKIKNR